MTASLAVAEILGSNSGASFKSGLTVVQGH